MLDSLYRIVALTRKELLAILKDRRSRFSIILPPILQCLIYGYVATYDLNHVPYAAFDRDRSAASQQLLARIDGSGVFQRVANLDRDVDIKTFIDNKRALLVIQIDRDFERWLLSDMPGAVQIIADGRNSNTAGTAIGYVNAIVDGFNTDWRQQSRPARSPNPDHDPRMVQPEPRNPLAHDSSFDRHFDFDPDFAFNRLVRSARARAGDLRSVAGDAVPPS